MSEETTTEQLAEIKGQVESTPATAYTPPEGWRVLAVGEVLQAGDMWVRPTDDQLRQTVHIGAVVGANQRYIRPIEPDKPQPQPAEYTPPEGWRVVRFGEQLLPGDVWVNEDGTEQRSNILQWDASAVSGGRCIRRIGPQPEPQPNTAAIEELRSEVSYVQNLLGTERRRVTELEELVASLRTINRGCENAVRDAGKENTALRNQLAAVKAELASVAADRQRLRVELDAVQQVPADSPELQQLRLDLAEVTQDRDTYKHAHELLVRDIDATHQRTKAMTVEAIAEWLVPVQAAIAAADNVAESTRAGCLAEAVIQHLPSIMRGLTGLVDEEPDPQLAPY